MTSVTTRVWATAALVSGVVMLGAAQQKPADPKDPRVGLKPGVKDAGVGGPQHGAGVEPAPSRRVLRSEGARG